MYMIEGKTVFLRYANENDAEFILSLRNNDYLNKYLSATSSDISSQKQWLNDYKHREKQGIEYYFIICRLDNNSAIGTVRLYDFIIDRNSFCWGSWILSEDKTRTAAIESALLVYEFAFNKAGFERSHFDVRKGNTSVIKFHNKFGVTQVGETDLDYLYEYSKSDYIQFSHNNKKFIGK
jgi:RimJ/RimL family protein N-acetyltransferase